MRLFAAIQDVWEEIFALHREQIAPYLKADHGLNYMYCNFDLEEMLSLAFLEGSNVSEHTQTEIYRVSQPMASGAVGRAS